MSLALTALDPRQFLRTIFDTIPLPAFVVDDDIRIQDTTRLPANCWDRSPNSRSIAGAAMRCIASILRRRDVA